MENGEGEQGTGGWYESNCGQRVARWKNMSITVEDMELGIVVVSVR